ncbi:hypothetical protein [Actinomadura alba]|uniref:Histone acetyltransferase Rv0428c-like SH3 domain-containing protein n=1 Tax=Actinomadura alba TaxID=406431 RepID=A0ABR7LR04_9ACTN|nr:hypothetical protein [Actinomadura alba]MBC6467024.1 hypothetical protein [Actinomadura alba]
MSYRFAARLVVTVTPSDVGQRVSLRRRLTTGEYSDVVGILESWSDGILQVRRRTGELIEVPENIVVAGKVVPPAPPRRRPRTEPSG